MRPSPLLERTLTRDRGSNFSRERLVPGGSIKARVQVSVKTLRAVEAGPNAPLLIRIVRHPFPLEVGQNTRRNGRPKQLIPERTDPLAPVRVEMAEARKRIEAVSPMRATPHRPLRRPSPVAFDLDRIPVDKRGWW